MTTAAMTAEITKNQPQDLDEGPKPKVGCSKGGRQQGLEEGDRGRGGD